MEFEPPLTATQLKKELRDTSPLGLNHVIRALDFLVEHQLVRIVDRTAKRGMKVYRISELGNRICGMLVETDSQSTNPTGGFFPTR
jgi:Fe2+ or Zn2+ uptake regulation protein